MADSVNNLLLVGFYLVNLGYVVYTLRIGTSINKHRGNPGKPWFKNRLHHLILGSMHFLNLYIFFTLRKKAMQDHKHKVFQAQ